MKNGYKVLDSDMHIMEPVDLWERYIDEKFAHLAAVHHEPFCTSVRATQTHADRGSDRATARDVNGQNPRRKYLIKLILV